MIAMLLAAGLGTRLRPLTETLPKCLVPIKGKPLLEYWLDNLLENGIDKVIINTHYLAPQVEQYVSNSRWKAKIILSHENELLGTCGTLIKNYNLLKGAAFLVAHADNLTIFNPKEFIKAHSERPKNTELTMMIFDSDDAKSCGIVELNDLNIVVNFYEKIENPPSNLANGAVYIFEKTVLEEIRKIYPPLADISTQLIPKLLGKIYAYKNDSYHKDIGNIKSWINANENYPN